MATLGVVRFTYPCPLWPRSRSFMRSINSQRAAPILVRTRNANASISKQLNRHQFQSHAPARLTKSIGLICSNPAMTGIAVALHTVDARVSSGRS